MNADRFAARLETHVERGEVRGLAWFWAEGDDVRSGAIGVAGTTDDRPMSADTIFRIASMTKLVAGAGLMVLVDRGVLHLDDPIDRWLPELADRRVLRTPEADLDDTVPADRPIVVRDLLASTMGIGWDFAGGPTTVMDALEAHGAATTPPHPADWPALDDWLAGVQQVPLQHQPGERWLYHTSYEVLGALVARAAGGSLGDFLAHAIFTPLGMTDTGFWVPADRRHRFTPCFGTGAATVYDPVDGEWAVAPTFESGGGGLVSTVADYAVFLDMVRRGGRGVLSPAAATALTTNLLTESQWRTAGPEPGAPVGWASGVSVQLAPAPGAPPVGSYGWAGGLGTIFRVDPSRDLVAVVLTNQAFLTPEPVPVVESFTSAFAT